MRDSSQDEDDRTRFVGMARAVDLEDPSPSEHDVALVLVVRVLAFPLARPGGEQPERQSLPSRALTAGPLAVSRHQYGQISHHRPRLRTKIVSFGCCGPRRDVPRGGRHRLGRESLRNTRRTAKAPGGYQARTWPSRTRPG